jgi:hypothetical protein
MVYDILVSFKFNVQVDDVVSSRSGLTTCLSTPATPATASETPASRVETFASALDSFKSEALSQLGIPTHLADRTDRGLHVAYEKYKAHLEACNVYERKLADGSWIGNKLTAMDLIQLFVSKSFWHSHYKPLFSKVSNYPDMVKWLEGARDRLSNEVLWGYDKSSYQFKDLKEYLEHRERKGKGKGKVKEKLEGGSKKKKKGEGRKTQVK